MGTYRHPRTLDGVAGTLPSRVSAGRRESYDVAEDGTFDAPESAAVTIARAYDLSIEDIAVGADGDSDGDENSGTCEVVKSDGEVCGRDRPCQYHD